MGPRTSAWRSAGNPAGRRLPSGREARARLRGGHILRLTATTRRPLNWATIWLLGCMCVCVCVCACTALLLFVSVPSAALVFSCSGPRLLCSLFANLHLPPGLPSYRYLCFFLCSSLRLPLSLSLWLSFPRLGCLYLALRLTRSLCPTLSLLSIYLSHCLSFSVSVFVSLSFFLPLW